MFGRSLRTPLGKPNDIQADHQVFDRIAVDMKNKQIQRWNKKYSAKYLPELQPGQLVWVKAPTVKAKTE